MTLDSSPRGPGAAGDEQSVSELATRRLGLQVRRVRVEKGLTLVDIAAATGLSVSMLSMLERGKTGVSVGSLVAVASALGVAVGELFHPGVATDSAVVRRADQPELGVGPGVTRRLIHRSREFGIEIARLVLDPGAHTGAELVRHDGREVVVVQSGSLTVQIAQDTFELAEGDAIHLDADRPHRFVNGGDVISEATLVVRLTTAGRYGH